MQGSSDNEKRFKALSTQGAALIQESRKDFHWYWQKPNTRIVATCIFFILF